MRRWRKMTWALVAWTALMLLWIILAGSNRPSESCPPGDSLCVDASDAGTGIGIGILFVLWFLGFMVLSAVWFMSRPKRQH